MKASRVCSSSARLLKSLGVTAFFWNRAVLGEAPVSPALARAPVPGKSCGDEISPAEGDDANGESEQAEPGEPGRRGPVGVGRRSGGDVGEDGGVEQPVVYLQPGTAELEQEGPAH